MTPGKFILVEPSNDTPPIVLDVVNVAALPVVFWFPVLLTPAKSMLEEPSNDTPPIVLAVSNFVAEPEFPDVS